MASCPPPPHEPGRRGKGEWAGSLRILPCPAVGFLQEQSPWLGRGKECLRLCCDRHQGPGLSLESVAESVSGYTRMEKGHLSERRGSGRGPCASYGVLRSL